MGLGLSERWPASGAEGPQVHAEPRSPSPAHSDALIPEGPRRWRRCGGEPGPGVGTPAHMPFRPCPCPRKLLPPHTPFAPPANPHSPPKLPSWSPGCPPTYPAHPHPLTWPRAQRAPRWHKCWPIWQSAQCAAGSKTTCRVMASLGSGASSLPSLSGAALPPPAHSTCDTPIQGRPSGAGGRDHKLVKLRKAGEPRRSRWDRL